MITSDTCMIHGIHRENVINLAVSDITDIIRQGRMLHDALPGPY